jgi:cytochrome b
MWTVVIELIVALIKGVFGTDTARKTTVVRPESEVTDGKTDAERLKDLGL